MNITFDDDGVQVVIYKDEGYEVFFVHKDELVDVEGHGEIPPKILKKAIEIGMKTLTKTLADEKSN